MRKVCKNMVVMNRHEAERVFVEDCKLRGVKLFSGGIVNHMSNGEIRLSTGARIVQKTMRQFQLFGKQWDESDIRPFVSLKKMASR